MPATADHITLCDAARAIFPHALGSSGYRRLYNIIHRRRRSCPVKFSYGRSARNGRRARYLRQDELPVLSAWVREITRS